MLSIEHHHRLRVKLGLAEDDAHVPTVTPLFPTANWLERETHDFYGIVFDGHPDPAAAAARGAGTASRCRRPRSSAA